MLNLKVNVVDICVLKALGLVHSERFMETMKDMKQLISVPSLVTISVEMVAEGRVLLGNKQKVLELKLR